MFYIFWNIPWNIPYSKIFNILFVYFLRIFLEYSIFQKIQDFSSLIFFCNIPYSKNINIYLVECFFWNIPGIFHIPNISIFPRGLFWNIPFLRFSYSVEYSMKYSTEYKISQNWNIPI